MTKTEYLRWGCQVSYAVVLCWADGDREGVSFMTDWLDEIIKGTQ